MLASLAKPLVHTIPHAFGAHNPPSLCLRRAWPLTHAAFAGSRDQAGLPEGEQSNAKQARGAERNARGTEAGIHTGRRNREIDVWVAG
eukprot:6211849-Pleurochrysis_carterae.AAC.5